MKLDLTKPLRREDWMKKDEKLEPLADELKKLVYGGAGLNQNSDVVKRADEMYAYYKLFKKLDTAATDTEYTPDELNIIKRVAAIAYAPGAYGQIVEMIDGK